MAEPTEDGQAHWESVHAIKGPEDVSWYRPHLDRSLEFIEKAGLDHGAHIIDVGGGASTLVDDLLDRGYRNVTVLDISPTAIGRARKRLGHRAAEVAWRVGDITQVELPSAHYDLWHDRAVFHFLTTDDARRRYVAAVRHAVRLGGHVIVATFGPEGPEKCSGLDVMRYSAEALHAEFGSPFSKIGSTVESHVTPWGTEQEFVYCYCRMRA